MNKNVLLKEYPLLLLLIIAGVLIFPNLGNSYLWQDEAETAFIAKNTLNFGVPLAFDGVNHPQTMDIYEGVSPEAWHREPYRYAPWLPFYITAGSFKIFGMNSFAARFPFAIFGFLSFILVWTLAQEIFKNRFVSYLALFSSIVSIPYILHIRQCHWFSMVAFFTLSALLSYLRVLNKRPFAKICLVSSLVLLFHSNHGIFMPVLLGISLHYISCARSRINWREFVVPGVSIAVLCIPFLYYLAGSEFASRFDSVHIRHQVEFYMRMINKWVFPWAALFNIWLIGSIIKRRFKWFLANQPEGVYLLLCVIASTLLFLIIPKVRSFRYIVHLIPLLMILQARIVSAWFKTSKQLATVGLLALIFTNIFTMGAPFLKPLRVLLLEHAYELTHDFNGPVEGMVTYLGEFSKKGDTVKVNYGDLPIMFYLDYLKVDNSVFRENKTFPEWIVYRKNWVGSDFFTTDYGREISRRYEKIVLNYPDTSWDNRPDPNEHKFKTDLDAPKLEIYKRK